MGVGVMLADAGTVGEEHFVPGDFVYINNESIPHGTELTSVDESKFWIARILEIKASDEFHVYLRIYWMYRPGDLKGGKQWHHGANEVVNSNHMDVVDAMTVIGKAQVGHWLEMDDDEELPMLYWRQIYDYMSKTVGEVRRHCRCDRYYNPDRKMYGCGNPACGKWLHEECLIEEVKKRVMERGGGPPPRTEYKMDVDITEGGGGLVKVAPKRKGGGTGVGVGLTVPALRTAAVPEMPKKNTHIAAGAVHAKNGKRKTKKEILAELEKIQVTFVDGKKVMAHVRDIRGVSATVGNKNHEHEHAEYKIQEWDETVDCLACGTTLE
ncbi:hypothetical protein BZA05DRAFT_412529 [Tricharina praecox]|uniref:uncharacterized protein n=1 Tax=Tricharina praecox TaxID=43433 RepID=UPI00221F03B5|nr:uncharacterized protein BZA05DRAFT_413863 [Tricharina praecox]XP_051334969.1 uncharacterized protein BZA05DRAFT_412529 [Tricharina praecox]KAI5840640.1 hypothetical protein BZA05DRAFT_413863 [Tricharina praecox]KAI5842068.1 hypothetical protein BZA05DRAFT_412529 [Tricharina praecox]